MEERIFSGKYRIQGEIASGGMGMVYHAIDLTLRREVAIKVLHKKYGGDPSFDQRFLQEARGLARLDHPNIVRIYAVEQEEGVHYIVMEYFPGHDLKHHLREHGPLPLPKALHIAIEITKALAYAHQKNIVHRDVKAGNILVGQEGQIKISDFGIAAILDEPGATAAGTIMGTPEYMSPEQAKGERVDGGSDMFSLGIVFYEMLTGTTPYRGLAEATIVGKLAYDRAEVDLVFPSSVPESLQYLIRGLTKKGTGDRIKDATLILETLKDHQEKLKSLSPEPDTDETILDSQYARGPTTSRVKIPKGPEDKPVPPSISQPSMSDASPSKTPAHLPQSSYPIRVLAFVLIASLFLVGAVVLILYQWPLTKDDSIREVGPQPPKAQESRQAVANVIHRLERLQRDYTDEITQQQATRRTLLGQMNTLLGNIHSIAPSLDLKGSQQQVKVAEQRIGDFGQQIREERRRQQSTAEILSQRVTTTLADATGISHVNLKDAQRRAFQEIPESIKASHEYLDDKQTSFKHESTKKLADLNAALDRKKDSLAKIDRRPPERKPPLVGFQGKSLEEILNQFRSAYENQDLSTLQQTTNMDGRRLDQVTLMFQAYQTIEIATEIQSITNQGASAKIVITKLIDQKGKHVKPNPIIKETLVRIPKKGNKWGKIQW